MMDVSSDSAEISRYDSLTYLREWLRKWLVCHY